MYVIYWPAAHSCWLAFSFAEFLHSVRHEGGDMTQAMFS